jgi:hypothetical protein
VQVIHHTNKHSTRYAVDYSHRNALSDELKKGGNAINGFVRKNFPGESFPEVVAMGVASVVGAKGGGRQVQEKRRRKRGAKPRKKGIFW